MHGAHTETVIALLTKLVAFDSVSRNSNLPIIDFIENYLSPLGIKCKRIPSSDGSKSNLLARIGPEVENGMIFSGHTDVVPIDGQAWDSDPFTVTRRGETLYGRGTADMKSFIAVCLALAPEFVKMKLARPIYFAFSYDEEVGCLGAPHMLSYIEKHIPKPAFALIGEPTLMQVVTAHKGVWSFETTVTGIEWHSSQPQYGVNAVQVACELVSFLTALAKECAEKGLRDERFDPPYSTVHTGVITGGTARNIIPKECHFNWEIRPLPGDDAAAILKRFTEHCVLREKEMKEIFPLASIISKPMSRMSGVTLPAHATDSCQLVKRCAHTNQEFAVSFGTEAGVFQDHGVPAIICGPGNIEQAHKPNEFIDIAQIDACVEFMLRLTKEQLG
jgi:acetylornithine deacetylase